MKEPLVCCVSGTAPGRNSLRRRRAMVTLSSMARGDMVGLTCASATTIVPSHGSLPASGVGISVTPSPYGTHLQEEGQHLAVQTPCCSCGNSPSRVWGAGEASSPAPRTHLFIQQAPSPCPHQSLNPTGRVWVFLQLRAKKHKFVATQNSHLPPVWLSSEHYLEPNLTFLPPKKNPRCTPVV